MINFEEAVEIASRYHKGQKDLDGNPVILHPLSVLLWVIMRLKELPVSCMIL